MIWSLVGVDARVRAGAQLREGETMFTPDDVEWGCHETAIPAAPRVAFPWSYGDLRAGPVTLTGYLAAVEHGGYCRVEVDGIGYHPKLADVRPASAAADDDDDAPCAECGCRPGERASDIEGAGTWALGWQCQCDCHADDDTSD